MAIRMTIHVLLLVFASAGCAKKLAPSASLEVAVKGLHSAAFHGTSGQALIGSIHHGGSLWHIANGERIYNWNHKKNEATTLVSADFSDNGRWALSADVHTLTLWDASSGRGERYWMAPGEILDAELNRNGSLALLGLSDHTAVIFDVRRGGVRRTFQHDNRVRSVDFSHNNRYAITGSEDHSAVVWDTSSGKELSRIKHDNEVQLVVLSGDGSLAFSVSKYDKALIWESRTGKILGELGGQSEHVKRGKRFTSAVFSSDNQFLLTGLPNQRVQLFDIKRMKVTDTWLLPKRDRWKPTSAAVIALAFADSESPPKRFYAAASNGFIHTLETSH